MDAEVFGKGAACCSALGDSVSKMSFVKAKNDMQGALLHG